MNSLISCLGNKDLLDEVGRLRYRAYTAAKAIPHNDDEIFLDNYDEKENCISFLYKIDNTSVGSIRANIHSSKNGWLPTAASEIYTEEIKVALGANTPYIESNRFAVIPDYGISERKLFFGLFKAIGLITLIEEAEFVITAVREHHAPFYRRKLGFNVISNAKTYFGLNTPMVLLAGNVKKEIKPIWDANKELSITDRDFWTYKTCGKIEL